MTQIAARDPLWWGLMGDLGLTWANGSADAAVVNDDLEVDEGLRTAVLLSLFLDRRAEAADELPGEDGDRRGWWGDEFQENQGDRIGSRNWLLNRSKILADLIPRAEEYDREALAWLLADGVAADVDVAVEIQGEHLYHLITITRPTGDVASFKFAHIWEGEASRGTGAATSAPPAYIDSEHVTAGGGTGSLVINKPTGTEEGDLMIAATWGFNSTSRVTSPGSGFSEIYHLQRTIEGQQHNFHVFSKVAGASEPASYTFTLNGTSAGKQGMIASYSDATAVEVTSSDDDTGSGESSAHSEAGVTTLSDNSTIVTIFGFDNNAGGAWALGASTGFSRTTRLDEQNADSSMRMYVADGPKITAGATGSIDQATVPSTVQGMAATLALKPVIN